MFFYVCLRNKYLLFSAHNLPERIETPRKIDALSKEFLDEVVVMDLALKFFFVATILLSMMSISLTSELRSKRNIVSELFQLQPNGNSPDGFLQRVQRDASTQGVSTRFCDMFGCENCNVPSERRCCQGFSYDRRSKSCRQLYSS
ncbi:hypothetical protein NPIL_536821 [Nephila pilipes]|uniref:Uncharacterized protein n=1 Tax=Nephila pilipes TaxID=299642 RepID=A0A8X6MVZ0_NEPPI|nr:hypothetical protein NPIL_536821 [Nephila pilipes]